MKPLLQALREVGCIEDIQGTFKLLDNAFRAIAPFLEQDGLHFAGCLVPNSEKLVSVFRM